MPRVLRIINRFNLGGPTFNASLLTKHMAPDFETYLLGGPNEAQEESSDFIPRSMGVQPHIMKEMKREISPLLDYVAYNKIKEIIKKFRPDIVHTHASKAGAIGRLAASQMQVPVIIHTFHGHVFDAYFSGIKSSFYKRIERRLSSTSTKIIALCEQQKHELVNIHKICREDQVVIIPLGFDLDKFQDKMEEKRREFRQEYNINNDEIVVTIVGRLVPIKNHDMFIRSMAEVKKQTKKKVRIFIVGDGEEKDNIINLAKSLQLSVHEKEKQYEPSDITMTSWIKEVDKVYAGSDIVAMTSLNEGTPVSLIEAQAANKAIITTNAGGIMDIVEDGKTALVSRNKDQNQFTTNMLTAVNDENIRTHLSYGGWEFVKKKFHYSRLVSDMKKLYYQQLSMELISKMQVLS